jgi:hypothetical protein
MTYHYVKLWGSENVHHVAHDTWLISDCFNTPVSFLNQQQEGKLI